ncbi:cell division protein FtsQ/DivIB [Ignatzschineria rhizosphaerae]|uniref:Cell division protein FtsQ n=1 Tax=Ignatzschineria rhizosphaerae TaxID=2923279 RepID=A0ABY3WWY6_9GAMM|nr:cell division protein FtsQ/DivIB [Ignatzschineria rhizosphaerae]UNM95123.1 cell division protein FtsQ/DivIB [Ignatzschineria rhizosphaerae]
MKRLQSPSQTRYRKARKKGRNQLGVVQKKPFDWGRFGYVLYRFFRFVFLVLLLVGIVAGPYYGWQYLKENNLFFKIETVSVYGEVDHLSQERINELVKDAVGQNLIGLDMQQYQDNILSESWIKSVSLKRQWLHELEVYLVEQDPIAIWNETQMVDADGEIFTPSFIPDQPWVYLSGPKEKVSDILVVYEETQRRLTNAGFQLKEIVLDENESWTILLDNDLLLIMGSEDYSQRLSRFLRQFPDRNVLDVIQHIDFRYKNGFSVKWKEDHQ